MKKSLSALALLAFTGLAMAASGKVTYSGPSLAGATVDKVVAKYAADTSQAAPTDPEKVLVLLNGSRQGFQRSDADAKVSGAKSVEVMGSNGSVVVNIITTK